MKTSVFSIIENIIQAPFVESTFEDSSVCFANNEDLRAEFKLQFTAYDVVNYVYGIYQLDFDENKKKQILLLKIPYPVNSEIFWQYCSLGCNFRKEHFVAEIEFTAVDQLNWEFTG